MTFLKRFLLAVLVFCTLGFSSAWAFDEHVMEQLEFESISLDVVAIDISDTDEANIDLSHDQNESDIACDHCCHIFSHLVAIFADARGQSTVGTSILLSNLTTKFHTFSVSPDLKPPRV